MNKFTLRTYNYCKSELKAEKNIKKQGRHKSFDLLWVSKMPR